MSAPIAKRFAVKWDPPVICLEYEVYVIQLMLSSDGLTKLLPEKASSEGG